MNNEIQISNGVHMARIAAVAFLGFVASTAGCVATINYDDNKAIVKMVANGADPISAKCAIRPQDSSPVCAISASRKLGR